MKNILILTLVFFILGCTKPPSDLKVSKIFNHNMVLQREQPVVVWGTALPGIIVKVNIGNHTTVTKTDEDGKWLARIDTLQIGGPYTIKIAAHDTSVKFNNVLCGDVWVCSGQSNMEWPLRKADGGDQEAAQAHFDHIRFFDIDKSMEFNPIDTLRGDMIWHIANDSMVAEFSAVGYFFGKKVHQETGIPIGLIGSKWGGTVVEAWTSKETIGQFSEFTPKLEQIATISTSVAEEQIRADSAFRYWFENELNKGIGIEEKWFEPDTDISDWKTMQIPSYWDDADPSLKDFDGAIWFRTTFDITPEFKGSDIIMWFGQIDDHNQVWVNGKYLGETFFSSSYTNYTVPSEILKEKENILVIRVYDVGGKGGFKGSPEHFDYYPVNHKALKLSTAGLWKYKPGGIYETQIESPLGLPKIGPNDFPTMLFNAMIHPILNFPIKGVIWYQGESNSGRAYQYRELFPALIKDWRNNWNVGDFPFYFVQLANFQPQTATPVESSWAELREAQTMTLELPNTGMATIIDIGEANDIHPTNKKDVGYRLAYNALAKTYGMKVAFSGPMYRSSEIVGNKIIIDFHYGDEMTTSDQKPVKGFAIAGADRKFYWANAVIDSNRIIVSSPKVPKPVAVRYAWADNPVTNLYNKHGLPAVPFRTDDWDGITKDRR